MNTTTKKVVKIKTNSIYGKIGRKLKIHACVLKTHCPDCGAKRGELCRGVRRQPILDTHYMRRHVINPMRNCLCSGCEIAGNGRINDDDY